MKECKEFVVKIESKYNEFVNSDHAINALKMGLKSNDFNITISEYKPEEIEMVPIVETGVLDFSPDIYVGMESRCDGRVAYRFWGQTLVPLSKYPELKPHCDPTSIKTTFDFSKINDGDLIEFEAGSTNKSAYIGRIMAVNSNGYLKVNNGYIVLTFPHNEIKSIRIIERAK